MRSTDKESMRNATDWRKLGLAIGHSSDNAIDWLKARYRAKFQSEVPLHIIPYRGYGNSAKATVTGRVLQYRAPVTFDSESLWDNLQDSYRRFETDEVPDVTVQAICNGINYATISDAEGYFSFEFHTGPTMAISGGVTASVELSLPEHESEHSHSEAELIIPPLDSEFGVISDVDDTVMVTHATSIIKMMRLTLLESSASRLAFSGVAEFYQALHQRKNPFFYVSSSPWNLYEFLDDFLELNGLVKGPLMLRDFGIDKSKLIAGPHNLHKLTQIRRILNVYPNLKFVLIGDSGQHDPEVYATIVDEFPNRILVCYIRDVSGRARDRDVQKIIDRLAGKGVDMLLVPDTLGAAIHAQALGLVPETDLDEIVASVRSA